MTDHTIELDKHRGMAAQKATELRRLVSEVAADGARLKAHQEELEKFLVSAPAANWGQAVEKARYLLALFAATPEAQDPRRKTLIANLLEDFERLLAPPTCSPTDTQAPPSKDE
ncbi:hypothetical protein [Microbaculum marinisediminis]|uniref:Uncharacterized protein n=1 Tax=Microbaculum marinisediminis TaxID=2931392 RepID=A0AAW5QRQ3_9HYPH|nr:hypothetical protein [Microbaculum sp. A6E488]MCT8970547.1 hypothetical protein [Microbaculum sp. A6E488]